jgi:hypothetical protein
MKRMMGFADFNISERMSHVNLDDFADAVSAAYEAAPVKEHGVEKYWAALNASNHKLFKQIKSKYDVVFQLEDPYSSAEEMRREVEDTHVLKIFSGDTYHPYFSNEDNCIFRAVHDYYTHIICGENFDLRGELRAYNTHAKLAPPLALPALFSEVIGQACYTIKHEGTFPEQKMAVLHGFDFKTVGEMNNKT